MAFQVFPQESQLFIALVGNPKVQFVQDKAAVLLQPEAPKVVACLALPNPLEGAEGAYDSRLH